MPIRIPPWFTDNRRHLGRQVLSPLREDMGLTGDDNIIVP